MTIKILYNFIPEIKSQIISIEVSNDFIVAWNCIDNEGSLKDAFYQSRKLTNDELNILYQVLHVQFVKREIPLWLLNEFCSKIELF